MENTELASSDPRSEQISPPVPKAAPWLVIPYGEGQKFQAFYNISEPSNTSCRKSIPELKGKSFFQKNSHQGWLIIICDDEESDHTPWNCGDSFLWNPLTMETIKLPSLLYWYTLKEYILIDCVLSSPPKTCIVTDDGDGKSMVFMLFVREVLKPGNEILVFCHPGDKEWRTRKFSDIYDVGGLRDMCYFKGKLYVMGHGDQHLEIETQHGSVPKILSINKIQISEDNITVGVGGISDTSINYYVETSDGIFKIEKLFIKRGIYECVTDMVISKLDCSSMSWVDVTSLDDHVFFLGLDTQLSCSANELGFTRGCVYFIQDDDEISFYMYDLEDKTVMLSLPCPDIPKPWFSPNWLMIQNTLIRDDENNRSGTESISGYNSCEGNNARGLEKPSLEISPIRTRTLNNDDIEETRPWDMLHDDIMWIISSFISLMDYIHLRAACRNYRSVFPIANRRKLCSTRSLQTTVLSPWMVFPKDNESVYSFINPMHNDENYLMSFPELLKGSTIRFSKGGWLLMSKGEYSVFFYNPFTKATIKLPDLGGTGSSYIFRGISFSSLPTSPDCAVFAISKYYTENSALYISFIKRGDRVWTFHFVSNVFLPPNRTNRYFEPGLNSPIFYNGSFYCLDVNATLGVFTLEKEDTKWEVLSMVSPPNCGFIYKSYLVELEGNLLSVLLGHYGKWVRIFRLDMSEMVWVEVEHLGRHAMFISNTSCIARIAPTSRMENKIYFPRLQNQGILFYSLDSGRYHSLGSEHSSTDYCNSNDYLRCSWIEPNWSNTVLPNNCLSDNSDGYDDDVCQDWVEEEESEHEED